MRSPTKLLSTSEYVTDITAAINASERSIAILSLVISQDDKTSTILDALKRAANRGVYVSVAMDLFFSYREFGAGRSPFHNLREHTQAIRRLKSELERAGVHVRWLGQAGPLLFSRRTHTKWYIVDDDVYCFGGINLYAAGLRSLDYVLKSHDPQLAERLTKEHRRILSSDRNGSAYRSYAFGDKNKVLIDGGMIGDSIIYRHVCRYTARASSVTYVSQYSPSGKLSRLLNKTPSKLYYNPSANASSANYVLLKFNEWFFPGKNHYVHTTYLHAKCMLFTMPDGEKIAITGSHNFSAGGVWLGTREVALETRDPQVIAMIEKFIKRYLD